MELMNEGLVVFDLEAASPEETVSKIAGVMEEQGRLNDRAAYVADVIKREEGAPTSIGFLIATPHAKSVHVKEPSLAFARLKDRCSGRMKKCRWSFRSQFRTRDREISIWRFWRNCQERLFMTTSENSS